MAHSLPGLVADIGGTHLRLGVVTHPQQPPSAVHTLYCRDYPDLPAALHHYLGQYPDILPRAAVFAIAAPVSHADDWIRMTNHPWQFSRKALQQQMGWQDLTILNDFAALALALPSLALERDCRVFMPGRALSQAPLALIGPGTGLGMAGLIPYAQGWLPLPGEGGHMTLAAVSREEADVLERVRQWYPHVSAERVLSGSGLPVLYRAVAEQQGQTATPLTAAEIAQRGLEASCTLCRMTLTHFCALLGTVAGNLVLTLGARGGLYLGGGILPQWGAFLDQSPFRQRFIEKGRYREYLEPVPGYLITATNPTLLGAAQVLHDA